MKRPRHLWLVVPIAPILPAGHEVVLYYVSSNIAASTVVFAGVFVLVALEHLGLLAPLYAMLRKWSSNS